MKIVINNDYGGFGLSDEAAREYLRRTYGAYTEEKTKYGYTQFYVNDDQIFLEQVIQRNDPVLVEIVERMRQDASGKYASLKVVEIPNDVQWHICEYDGMEHVAEDHRVWR